MWGVLKSVNRHLAQGLFNNINYIRPQYPIYNSTSLPLIEQHKTQTQQINPRDQAYYWEPTHFKRLGYYY